MSAAVSHGQRIPHLNSGPSYETHRDERGEGGWRVRVCVCVGVIGFLLPICIQIETRRMKM